MAEATVGVVKTETEELLVAMVVAMADIGEKVLIPLLGRMAQEQNRARVGQARADAWRT